MWLPGDGGERLRAARARRGGHPLHDPRPRPDRRRPTPPRERPLPLARPRRTRTGRTVDLVVYDGGLAHALAFDAPTSRRHPRRRPRRSAGSWSAATDGETFGHHHDGADEVVARALAVAEPAYGVRRAAPGRPARRSPPDHRGARAHQRLVVRPRRAAVDGRLRLPHRRARRAGTRRGEARCATPSTCCATGASRCSSAAGPSCCATRGRPATTTSGCCIGARTWDDFAGRHIIGDGHQAGVLLDAQRNAVLMYTSCGWFFNDLAGIETIQVLRYAARCHRPLRAARRVAAGRGLPRDPRRGPLERPRRPAPAATSGSPRSCAH